MMFQKPSRKIILWLMLFFYVNQSSEDKEVSKKITNILLPSSLPAHPLFQPKNQHIMQIILRFLAFDGISMSCIYMMNHFGKFQVNLYYETQFNLYYENFKSHLFDPILNPEPELKLHGFLDKNEFMILQAAISSKFTDRISEILYSQTGSKMMSLLYNKPLDKKDRNISEILLLFHYLISSKQEKDKWNSIKTINFLRKTIFSGFVLESENLLTVTTIWDWNPKYYNQMLFPAYDIKKKAFLNDERASIFETSFKDTKFPLFFYVSLSSVELPSEIHGSYLFCTIYPSGYKMFHKKKTNIKLKENYYTFQVPVTPPMETIEIDWYYQSKNPNKEFIFRYDVFTEKDANGIDIIIVPLFFI